MANFFSPDRTTMQQHAGPFATRLDQDLSPTMQQLPTNQNFEKPRSQGRASGQMRSQNGYGVNGDHALPIPQGPTHGGSVSGISRNGGMMAGPQPLDVARSPPATSSRNTKHVPCKFFRQGACQAGNACPFSHVIDPQTDRAPCKYFMKGNCKFGAKCALAHIMPDGRPANRAAMHYGPEMAMSSGPFNIGGRVEPPIFHNPDSALATSILTQQQYQPDNYPHPYPYIDRDDGDAFEDRFAPFHNGPTIESGLSPPRSQYGSPPEEARFPKSPIDNIRTALNAPLPQSFDSNGVSRIAQFGQFSTSVPNEFGIHSPPESLPKKSTNPWGPLPGLRSPLFSTLSTTTSAKAEPLRSQYDETNGLRSFHALKSLKPRMVSASVPRTITMDDWEDRFDADLLPGSLHDDVLTPQEKMRRLSRPEQDFVSGAKDEANALAIPSGSSSKVGSPSAAGSPSRFRAIFEQQRGKEKVENTTSNGPSAFNQVGSPLRESWMADQNKRSPDDSPFGGLSQHMQRIQLNRAESTELNGGRLQPSTLRHSSAPVGRFDRTISSPGISSTKIDEENEGVFSMDEENGKRSSVIWGSKSPNLRPLNDDSTNANQTAPIDMKRRKEFPNGLESIMFGVRP